MKKECRSCHSILDVSHFWKCGLYHHPTCKLCNQWINRYKQITRRCNNPTDIDYPRYGGRGIKCLITENDIKGLWFRDKAYEMKMPSLDRKDNDGHYTVENCQFIEHGLNANKDKKWFIEKQQLYHKVYQYLGPIYN